MQVRPMADEQVDSELESTAKIAPVPSSLKADLTSSKTLPSMKTFVPDSSTSKACPVLSDQ